MNKKYYEEHIEWIKNNKEKCSSRQEVVDRFNQEFNSNVSFSKIVSICRRYKISLRFQKFSWKEKIDWLKANKHKYNDREDILNDLNKQFNTKYTLFDIKDMNTKCKLNLPTAKRRIHKGLINARIKLLGIEQHEIGDECYRSGKNIYIKTDNTNVFKNNFTLKHRYLYEKYYNEKLKVDDVVLFLDGDYTNFSKENLYKVDKKIQRKMLGHNLYNTKTNRLCIIKILEWETKIKELENDK